MFNPKPTVLLDGVVCLRALQTKVEASELTHSLYTIRREPRMFYLLSHLLHLDNFMEINRNQDVETKC